MKNYIPYIRREDYNTFYIQSSKDPNKEYMIFYDNVEREYATTDRWLCECTDFWIHLPGEGKPVYHKCKHILRCMLLL